jgi:hypothetical protein
MKIVSPSTDVFSEFYSTPPPSSHAATKSQQSESELSLTTAAGDQEPIVSITKRRDRGQWKDFTVTSNADVRGDAPYRTSNGATSPISRNLQALNLEERRILTDESSSSSSLSSSTLSSRN